MNERQIEAFLDHIKEGLYEADKDKTDPDDDFNPLLFALRPCEDPEHEHAEWDEGEEKYDFGLIYLDPEFLNGHQDALAKEVIPHILGETGAHAAVYMASTWTVLPDENWPKEMVELIGEVRPSQHPWRSEAIMLLVVTKEPSLDRTVLIPMTRDERRVPYLEEKEIVHKEDDDGHHTGRFYEGMVKGIRGEEAQTT